MLNDRIHRAPYLRVSTEKEKKKQEGDLSGGITA